MQHIRQFFEVSYRASQLAHDAVKTVLLQRDDVEQRALFDFPIRNGLVARPDNTFRTSFLVVFKGKMYLDAMEDIQIRESFVGGERFREKRVMFKYHYGEYHQLNGLVPLRVMDRQDLRIDNMAEDGEPAILHCHIATQGHLGMSQIEDPAGLVPTIRIVDFAKAVMAARDARTSLCNHLKIRRL